MNWYPFSQQIKPDPYPFYAESLQKAKVQKSFSNLIYVLDYKNIKKILSSSVPFFSPGVFINDQFKLDTYKVLSKDFLFTLNGKEHADTATFMRQCFVLNEVEVFIETLSDTLIQNLKTKKKIDKASMRVHSVHPLTLGGGGLL